MKKAICTLKSLTPITFGRQHETEKLKGESHEDYENRTWKEKVYYDESGYGLIKGIMVANCIRASAKYLNRQIPGKGKSTFTKHFNAGIIILDNIVLKETRETIQGTRVNVPSDGMVGGTKRVARIFPIVHEWEGQLMVIIGDDVITEDVFTDVLQNAGNLIGLGTWRPISRGMNGRFEAVNIKWIDERI